MFSLSRTLIETTVVAAVATGFGLAANAVYPDGLSLTRDYFLVRDGGPQDGNGVTEQAVRERLAQLGLNVLEHDAVVALFQDELYEAEAYVFVDARNDEHYREGHIPGAWPYDHYRFERYIDDLKPYLETAMTIVVYCYGKDCTDSELAAQQLMNLGVEREKINVYVAGIQGWKDAGLPVERGERNSGERVQ